MNPSAPSSSPLTLAAAASARSNNFDFLRFLMACIVIHTHSYHMVGILTRGLKQRLTTLDLGGAWIAVDVFFLISGFLITNSFLHSKSLSHFLKKRALRIYPGFIAAILFCILLVGPLGGALADASLPAYLSNPKTWAFALPLLFAPVQHLPGVFTTVPWTGSVNDSLWTIRFELLCYTLPALLGLLGLLRSRTAVAAIFALAIATQTLQVLQIPHNWTMVYPWVGDIWELPRFLTYFLAGITYYLWRDRIPLRRSLLTAALALIALGFATNLSTVALPLALPYVVFYAAFSKRLPLNHFGKYGDFSYGMYLYAFPVQQLLVDHHLVGQRPILLTALAFLITLGLAILSWHFVEKPFLRLKNVTPVATTPLTLTPTPNNA